jgi:hypothetical protein
MGLEQMNISRGKMRPIYADYSLCSIVSSTYERISPAI